MKIATLLMSALGLAFYVQADHSDLVNRAIMQSRQRQTSRVASANRPAPPPAAAKKGVQQQRPLGATKAIDVDALNNLIKSFDKTWVMPKAGAKEPVGSNFQYKKTCASIYKARPDACSQLGFGSMCFNYCFEKGEKVSYQCVDASDAAYCKSSSNFESFFTKYKKDAYKAKAYIHQMISRCFATALCNANGILEAQPTEAATPKPREMSHLKLTRPAAGGVTKKSPGKATTAAAATTTTTETPEEQPSPKPAGKPKKVPEWQKLMGRATTEKSVKEEDKEEYIVSTTEAEESMEEVEIEVEEEETTVSPSTRASKGPSRKSAASKAAAGAAAAASTTSGTRATFKPLPRTTAPPPAAEKPDTASHTSEKTPKEDTFWNRFQPNTWYQSIHYLTNTGR